VSSRTRCGTNQTGEVHTGIALPQIAGGRVRVTPFEMFHVSGQPDAIGTDVATQTALDASGRFAQCLFQGVFAGDDRLGVENSLLGRALQGRQVFYVPEAPDAAEPIQLGGAEGAALGIANSADRAE